jgi:hypothetical protein
MRKLSSLVLTFVTIIILNGCSNIYRVNKAELAIIPASDVTTNPAKWENIGKDILQGKEYVFQILKGQSIPINVTFNTPFADLKAGKNTVLFTKDIYLMISKTKMRVSPDGSAWADIADMQSIKTLFDFTGGNLSLGFSAAKETGPTINLDISAK